MLYLVKTLDYYKVGFSQAKSIKTRMQAYATHNPLVELIGIKEGDRNEENQYHTSFAKYEGVGEWFKVPKEVIDVVKQDFTPSDLLIPPKKRGKRTPYKYNYTPKKCGILQYSKNGEFLNRFVSIQQASDTTGVTYSVIWGCLHNKKSRGKYIWKFEKKK